MAGKAKGKKSPTSKLQGHSLFKTQDKIGSFYFSVKWNCRGKKHISLTLRIQEGVPSEQRRERVSVSLPQTAPWEPQLKCVFISILAGASGYRIFLSTSKKSVRTWRGGRRRIWWSQRFWWFLMLHLTTSVAILYSCLCENVSLQVRGTDLFLT